MSQVGDRRLGDHLLNGLESLLPLFFALREPTDTKCIRTAFEESRFTEEGVRGINHTLSNCVRFLKHLSMIH